MAEKTIAGVTVQVDDEGYLLDPNQWTEELAREMAKEEGLELTDQHLAVLKFLREKYLGGETLTIRAVGKSGNVDIKGFYKLFPGAPLKKASKYAGLPKPSSCV